MGKRSGWWWGLVGLVGLWPVLAAAQTPVLPGYQVDSSQSGVVQHSWNPVSAANPLPVSGSFAFGGGFTAASTGTPISATTGGATGTLPAGLVVVATNVGATNGAYCALGASASTSSQYLSPGGGWFAFQVGSATQLTCVTGTSTTTVNMTGGSGLPTGTGGGGGGGGGGGAITSPLGPSVADASQVAVTTNSAGTLGTLLSNPPNVTVNGANGALTGLTPGVAQTGTIVGLNTDKTSVHGTALGAVVSNLGTLASGTPAAENVNAFIVGGTAAGTVSNASSGVATSSTNTGAVSWLYGFNGTTWDQLQVDGSKNLKVTGLGIAQGSASSGQTGSMVLGAATTSAPTDTTGDSWPLSMTVAGGLRMDVASQDGTALGTPVAWGSTPSGNVLSANVDCVAGCSGSVAPTDGAAFTAGTTTFNDVGGQVGAATVTSGHMGAFAMLTNRDIMGDLDAVSGTALANGTETYGTAFASQSATVPRIDAFVTNTNANGQATMANSSPVAIASNQSAVPVSPTTYPATAVPVTASATGTTAATTATLVNVTGHTTYICGFSIRANATAASTTTATMTGVVTGTMSFVQWAAPLASGLGVTEEVFNPCIPASAVSTSIAVVSGAPGSGGTVSVAAWGYSI